MSITKSNKNIVETVHLNKGVAESPIFTTVFVNGRSVSNALLDTSASVTIVNKDFVDHLGLAITPRDTSEIIVANDE